TGLTSKAIECYAQALELAQTLRDTAGECSVWTNLGLALIYSAQYRDALCCLHLEDFSRGLKACETAIKEVKEPHSANDLVSSVLREHHYIRLLLEVNSVERAAERCAVARRHAGRSK